MKIYVAQPTLEKPIHMSLPNTLVFNKITSHLLSKNANLDSKKVDQFIIELKRVLEEYGSFNLIHIEKEDGTLIDIDL